MDSMTVDAQPQPKGEAGVNFSLLKVAEFIAESRMNADVIALARRVVRDAGYPKGDLEIARAMWQWMRDNGIRWLRDPARGEFMANARHFLRTAKEDGTYADDAYLVAGDCDELTILLLSLTLAAISSVGVETCAVLGHSYSSSKMIGHVLCAVHDGAKWHRIDPSLDEPFGAFKKATREKMIAVPSCSVICDADSCASGPRAARPPPLHSEGNFAGVHGVEMSTEETASALGATEDGAMWHDLLVAQADTIAEKAAALAAAHQTMVGVMMALDITPAGAAEYGWTSSEEKAFASLVEVAGPVEKILRETADGKRKVGVMPVGDDFAILASDDDDFAMSIDDDGHLKIGRRLQVNTTADGGQSSELTGLGFVLPAAFFAVLMGSAIYLLIKAVGLLTSLSEEATERALHDRYAECAKAFSPERCAKLAEAVGVARSAKKTEERKIEEQATEQKKVDLEADKWKFAKVAVVVAAAAATAGAGYLVAKKKGLV